MPEIRFGEIFGQDKENQQGHLLLVGRTGGKFKRVIPFRPLGSLHPVKDKISFSDRPGIQVLDSGRMDHISFTHPYTGRGHKVSIKRGSEVFNEKGKLWAGRPQVALLFP